MCSDFRGIRRSSILVTDIKLKFVCQTSTVDNDFFLVFLNVHALLFLTISLLHRCQIVTDTFKEMLQSLLASHLNHLFHYTNKNISVKPLFNLHYLSLFQLPFTRSKIVQLMEDLAVITALNQ